MDYNKLRNEFGSEYEYAQFQYNYNVLEKIYCRQSFFPGRKEEQSGNEGGGTFTNDSETIPLNYRSLKSKLFCCSMFTHNDIAVFRTAVLERSVFSKVQTNIPGGTKTNSKKEIPNLNKMY